VSVATVVTQGLDLQARLTTVAATELATVHRIIECTSLRVGHDSRTIDSPSAPRFCSQEAYRSLSPVHPSTSPPVLLGPSGFDEGQDLRVPRRHRQPEHPGEPLA
jgi:hypothetical protein